ncbi:MAG: ParB/RepB/Spo0J family partition protein [Myxococcota bacterium]
MVAVDDSMDQKRKALGRGLAALIPGAETPAPAPPAADASGLRTLSIERIRPNPEQPRKTFEPKALEELAESIKEHGVLQPLVVRRVGSQYQIVAGERRWRAAAKAGLHEVPALIKDFADSDVLAVALVENVQRQDLDPLEEADAYRRLVEDYDLSHDDVAAAVGKSRSAVTNALRLLKMPHEILEHLGAGRLTAGHARAVMTVNDDMDAVKLANDVAQRKLSVRETEHRARALRLSKKRVKSGGAARSKSEVALEERLQAGLGTKVRLHHRGGKGKLELSFHSLEHLDELVDRLLR